MNFLRGKLLNFWTTKPRGVGGKALVVGPLKKTFFAASLKASKVYQDQYWNIALPMLCMEKRVFQA
jgi:hypothetical protein